MPVDSSDLPNAIRIAHQQRISFNNLRKIVASGDLLDATRIIGPDGAKGLLVGLASFTKLKGVFSN